MKKQFFLMLLILVIPLSIIAQWAPADNRITLQGVGAKAIAMNGAFTAIADDYSATFWNPAATSFINCINLGVMHSQMSLNRRMEFLSCTMPISYKNHISFSWAAFKISEIEARTANSLQPDYIFDNTNYMIWTTYSRRLLKQLSLGLNVKFFQSQLSNSKAMGGGIDFGLMYNSFKNFRVSFVSQDIGSTIKWDTKKKENFARVDRFGCSYDVLKKVLLAIDLISRKDKTSVAFGTEIRLSGLMKVRSGMQESLWSLGTGLTFPIKNRSFVVINYTIKMDSFNEGIFHIFDFNFQQF